MPASGFSLYLHIPFCLSRCGYCSFTSSVIDPVPEGAYLQAVLNELAAGAACWSGRPIKSIYVGGGTPSLLSPAFYEGFFARLFSRFTVVEGAEITLEANPATLTREKIKAYLAVGINRFSLGLQTFTDQGLKLLGRCHTVADGLQAVAELQHCGVDNLSLDLIYAYPGQTIDALHGDLEQISSLGAAHIAAYCLSIEPETPLGQAVAAGTVVPVGLDLQAGFMEEVNTVLDRRGYRRYEISNYARTGFASRHNQAYWNLDDYWGLGAGAWSSRRVKRDVQCWAVRTMYGLEVVAYMTAFRKPLPAGDDSAPAAIDCISYESSFAERIIMGLRLIKGVDLEEVAAEYDYMLVADLLQRLQPLIEVGLLKAADHRLRLTGRGLLLADEIALEVLA